MFLSLLHHHLIYPEYLHTEVAAREAELRPPEQTKAAEEPAPDIRPEDMPPKIKISNEMKSRLRQELISQGADPNKSAGNPILVISAIIAILVVIGGKGKTDLTPSGAGGRASHKNFNIPYRLVHRNVNA